MLAVDPPHQGTGLASLLIRIIEDHCRRAGCTRLDLDIINLRTELPAFYARFGFVQGDGGDGRSAQAEAAVLPPQHVEAAVTAGGRAPPAHRRELNIARSTASVAGKSPRIRGCRIPAASPARSIQEASTCPFRRQLQCHSGRLERRTMHYRLHFITSSRCRRKSPSMVPQPRTDRGVHPVRAADIMASLNSPSAFAPCCRRRCTPAERDALRGTVPTTAGRSRRNPATAHPASAAPAAAA